MITLMGIPGEEDLPTLFEWAGGEEPIGRMINAFYDRVEGDPELAPLFGGAVSAEHRVHVVAWWCEVFGGPKVYSSEFGGYATLIAKHRKLGISAVQRHHFAALMSLAADDAGLPDDPEFRAALIGYLEWGTRLAFLNSQPGAPVVLEAPMPSWGWGVAPPYVPGS